MRIHRVMSIVFLIAACVQIASRPIAQSTIFSTTFDSGIPPQVQGAGVIESVQGFAGLGNATTFEGRFLRNTSGCPSLPTTLKLTNLPAHSSVDIVFLLAIIDTWDGLRACCGPDYLEIRVDGKRIFRESFMNAFGGGHPYSPRTGVLLAQGIQLGFRSSNVNDQDSAFDMGREPRLRGIAHTAPTLVVEWQAAGQGWHHTCAGANADQSWAIDRLSVILDSGATAAVESVRHGSPANPHALLRSRTNMPTLGMTWDPVVDHSTFVVNPSLDLLAISALPTNSPFPPFGTLLCRAPILDSVPSASPGSPFQIRIPNNPSLSGVTLSTQAISVATSGQILLTNAIDVTIGAF